MDSEDLGLTPITTRTKLVDSSPRSVEKRTILSAHLDASYIEEEDDTYIHNETTVLSEVEEETDVELDLEEEKESLKDKPQPSRLRKFVTKHEIPRKMFHSSIAFLTIWLYTLGVNQKQLILPLAMIFLVIFINDYVRLHNPEINKRVVGAFWFVIRDNEVHEYNGVLYYLVGLILVFTFLPKDISMLSVLLLSWADTAASTFGRLYGKYTFKIGEGKSFAGALASFAVGVFSAYLLYGYLLPEYAYLNKPEDILWTPETSALEFYPFIVCCGAIASVSELVNIFGIDDNFTVPVLSGFSIYGLVRYFEV